jgi:hypothetical protein
MDNQMTSKVFLPGKQYFLITHFDEELSLFGIESFVFRTEKITRTGDSLTKRWLFQSAHSFATKGPLEPTIDVSNEELLIVGEDMIEDFLDHSTLISRLNDVSH